MLLVPVGDRLGDAEWVVTHGKVIAFGDDDLLRRRKERLPPWLESKGIVALAEDRQQRKVAERAGECPVQFPVDRAVAGVAQVFVKGAHAPSDADPVGLAAPRVEMPSDSKRGGRDARKDTGREIEAPYRPATHQREHAAERRARWTPAERVDADEPNHRTSTARARGKRGRPTSVVHDERHV